MKMKNMAVEAAVEARFALKNALDQVLLLRYASGPQCLAGGARGGF